MSVFFNGELRSQESFTLDYQNRAFQYGDGLFETIIMDNGKIRYLEDHIHRISEGMKILGMEEVDFLEEEKLGAAIKSLCQASGLSIQARIKLQIWRKQGGLYSPQNNKVDSLITVTPIGEQQENAKRVGYCESIRLTETIISKFKTCNSLPYILSSLEKKHKQLDDLILLSAEGFVAECIASNIFWKKNEDFFTPSLATGCIGGIRRKNIIKSLNNEGIKIYEVESFPEMLLEAESIFSCNVAGLYPIQFIGEQEYPLPNFLDLGIII